MPDQNWWDDRTMPNDDGPDWERDADGVLWQVDPRTGHRRAVAPAVVEWGVKMPDGRVEVCPSEHFARRFARNDARREVVTRTVAPWEASG